MAKVIQDKEAWDRLVRQQEEEYERVKRIALEGSVEERRQQVRESALSHSKPSFSILSQND